MGEHDCKVSTVSIWTVLRVHVFAVVLGLWVLFKRFLLWAWNPNSFFALQQRDNPPACLVDSTLGRHSYVKLKGVKFHYVERGMKHNPLLLLLHGFPDCWLSWRHQLNILGDDFHVVAVDLKGFGDSDKPQSRKSYRIETLLNELSQFVSALGASSCILMGHDLGAIIGWYFVHAYPHMVDKFISVSCTHPNLYWDSLSNQSMLNSFWINFIQLPYLPELDVLKHDLQLINDSLKHLSQKSIKDSNSIIEAYKYSFSRKEDWTGPLNYYRNLPFIRMRTENSHIIVPTLLVTGSQDQIVRLENVVKSTDFCEKFVVKIVEDAGHFPHQENPDMFNKIVLNYLLSRPSVPISPDRNLTKGLMDRMFGAVSSTVKYGNSMLDVVQKKTNGVVSLPSRSLQLHNAS